LRGPCSPLYDPGEQGYMKSPNRVLLGSQSEEFSWFPSMSTSSTPIWVDTKEVGHIHVLFPTLEYSVPVGSPAVPGLTGRDLHVPRTMLSMPLHTKPEGRRCVGESPKLQGACSAKYNFEVHSRTAQKAHHPHSLTLLQKQFVALIFLGAG
jgi:hypothetical protein